LLNVKLLLHHVISRLSKVKANDKIYSKDLIFWLKFRSNFGIFLVTFLGGRGGGRFKRKSVYMNRRANHHVLSTSFVKKLSYASHCHDTYPPVPLIVSRRDPIQFYFGATQNENRGQIFTHISVNS